MTGARTESSLPPERRDLKSVLLRLAEKGKCAGSEEPDTWWPVLSVGRRESPELSRWRAASLCAGCPVLAPCRWYALEAGEGEGVWGGLSEQDRAALRSKRSRQVGFGIISSPASREGGGDAA